MLCSHRTTVRDHPTAYAPPALAFTLRIGAVTVIWQEQSIRNRVDIFEVVKAAGGWYLAVVLGGNTHVCVRLKQSPRRIQAYMPHRDKRAMPPTVSARGCRLMMRRRCLPRFRTTRHKTRAHLERLVFSWEKGVHDRDDGPVLSLIPCGSLVSCRHASTLRSKLQCRALRLWARRCRVLPACLVVAPARSADGAKRMRCPTPTTD